ncbi:MAG: transposase [Deltaproteobacteria bacterium]|nr:transposase [Deltaproteobacteria bacterium]
MHPSGTLREHRELLLNWFKAKKEISSGVVERLNTTSKLALRKACGLKKPSCRRNSAAPRTWARLPEPEFIHRFC